MTSCDVHKLKTNHPKNADKKSLCLSQSSLKMSEDDHADFISKKDETVPLFLMLFSHSAFDYHSTKMWFTFNASNYMPRFKHLKKKTCFEFTHSFLRHWRSRRDNVNISRNSNFISYVTEMVSQRIELHGVREYEKSYSFNHNATYCD